jgi:diacylglycerol kinase (ATP)
VRALAILNPAAGSGKAGRVWERVGAELACECATTDAPGHARELARAAAEQGYERVIAVGGDGTAGEVASGLAHSQTALGLIPVGTGNDTARSLGIPSDPLAAARLAAHGPIRPIDLGQIQTAQQTTHFVNVAGFGFDAEVAWHVNRMAWLKAIGGTAPYLGGVLQTLWQYRAPRMRISIDNQPLPERGVFLIAVANFPSYGGGMLICPPAQPDDGLFDVCVVTDLSRPQVLRLVPKLYSGRHVGHPAVELLRCRELSAAADRRVRCQADGELVGDLPVRFSLLPAALRCVAGPAVPGSST